ncbi:MAG: DUF427 domain-containing protein [Pseudomonadota bacterium]
MTEITLEPAQSMVVVRAGGAVIVESTDAVILRETGYDPVFYFPREDASMFLEPSAKRTTCPHKGEASYFNIVTKSGPIQDAAWSYETPVTGMDVIKERIAFSHERVAVEQL